MRRGVGYAASFEEVMTLLPRQQTDRQGRLEKFKIYWQSKINRGHTTQIDAEITRI
jgi:hypothetical protein